MIERNKIYTGDALELLHTFPDNTFHACITSPPYFGLRDYGTAKWEGGDSACEHSTTRPQQKGAKQATSAQTSRDSLAGLMFCRKCGARRIDKQLGLEPTVELYVEHILEIFREVRRTLRNDGVCFVVLGDSYTGSGKCSGRTWENGKIPNMSGKQHSNTGSLGVGKTPPIRGLKSKNLIGVPWRIAFALQDDGWILRQEIIWNKTNAMVESVTDRCTRSHEQIFMLTKSERYYYDAEAVREPSTERPSGNLKRKVAIEGEESRTNTHLGYSIPYTPKGTGRNRRSVWSIPTKPFGAHYATFPIALIEPMILVGTSEKGCCPKCGAPWHRNIVRKSNYKKRETAHAPKSAPSKVDSTGWNPPTIIDKGWLPTCSCGVKPLVQCLVLDLFAGSGTVAETAIRLGRDYVLIELNPQYVKIAEKRIANVATMKKVPSPDFEEAGTLVQEKVFEEMKLL